MKNMRVHGVVGVGDAPAPAISEAVRDALGKGDGIAVQWCKPTNTAMEAIYDYLLEHEVTFTMYYEEGQNPPRVFREADHGECIKVRDAYKACLEAAILTDGHVLYLWDDEADPAAVEAVFEKIPKSILVLELTNGLAPISFDQEIPEPVEPEIIKDPEDEDVPDDEKFTKDELEVMTALAVKRYGARLGCESKTKGGIIEELFPEGEEIDLDESDIALVHQDAIDLGVFDTPEGGQGEPDGNPTFQKDLESLLNHIRFVLTNLAEGRYN